MLYRLLLAPLVALAVVVGCPVPALAQADAAPMDAIVGEDFAFAAAQYSGLLEEIGGQPGLPRSFEAGKRRMVGPEDWTSGFFPGALWLLYDFTRDVRWRTAAEATPRASPACGIFPATMTLASCWAAVSDRGSA